MLPLGLIAAALARLPWRIGWVKVLYVELAAMAVVFAAIGVEQYLTRTIYWNPKVTVDNAYAPVGWYFRVNSVFYDPSIYGRFLVVAILASLVLVLFDRGGEAWIAAGLATATLIGLLPSFSQSSFVALAAGIAVVADRALAPEGDPAARARRGGARRAHARRAAAPPPRDRQGRDPSRDRRPGAARHGRDQDRGTPPADRRRHRRVHRGLREADTQGRPRLARRADHRRRRNRDSRPRCARLARGLRADHPVPAATAAVRPPAARVLPSV